MVCRGKKGGRERDCGPRDEAAAAWTCDAVWETICSIICFKGLFPSESIACSRL